MNEIRPIDANALVEGIEELKRSPWYNGENDNYERLVRADAIGTVVDLCIKAAPTLDYAPVRHGEWEYSLASYSMPRCSCCGWSMPYSEDSQLDARNYCPNCGAKMDGGKKDG